MIWNLFCLMQLSRLKRTEKDQLADIGIQSNDYALMKLKRYQSLRDGEPWLGT